ncbi:MAG: hypothetical protein ACW97A_02765 [Candidatus Thorarchaeota archaeon]|jgi:hypothetical protein
MSLHDRIPEQLKLREALISVTMEEDVEVFPTSDYVLIEVSPKAGKINIPKIVTTVRNLVKADKLIVAVRGYGFKGIGLSVRIAHELKIRETQFKYQMVFDTFDAAEGNSERLLTSVQIIIIPPN